MVIPLGLAGAVGDVLEECQCEGVGFGAACQDVTGWEVDVPFLGGDSFDLGLEGEVSEGDTSSIGGVGWDSADGSLHGWGGCGWPASTVGVVASGAHEAGATCGSEVGLDPACAGGHALCGGEEEIEVRAWEELLGGDLFDLCEGKGIGDDGGFGVFEVVVTGGATLPGGSLDSFWVSIGDMGVEGVWPCGDGFCSGGEEAFGVIAGEPQSTDEGVLIFFDDGIEDGCGFFWGTGTP